MLTQNALPAMAMIIMLGLFWNSFTTNQNYLWLYTASLALAGGLSLLYGYAAGGRRCSALVRLNSGCAEVMQHSLPLAPVSFVSFLMLWIDTILTDVLLPNARCPVCGGSPRFLCQRVFLGALDATIYPRLLKIHRQHPQNLRHFFWQGTLLVAGILGGVTLLIGLAGEWILEVFKPSYTDAYTALLILLVAQLIRGLGLTFSFMFIIQEQVRTLNILLYCALAVNIVANLILIPRFGIEGSAGASLIANLALTGGVVLFFLKKRLLQDYD
ncbi:MAG: polysaccharide biosynthesis C-terminal domain-containing protein [Thiolinea sp.]